MHRIKTRLCVVWKVATFVFLILFHAAPSYSEELRRDQIIPVIGVCFDGQEQTGAMVHLMLSFEERTDRSGLIVHFNDYPGRFSRMAQASVRAAIERAANAVHMSTDSWSIMLTVPYKGVTIFGESLSAMVALSALAMASGQLIAPGVVLTGTIKEDGLIGPVGAVSLKLQAARYARLKQVLISTQENSGDKVHPVVYPTGISSVRTVSDALNALTYEPG